MKNFQYYRPGSVEEAVGLLGAKWGKVELLAGGTDLLDLQKEYVAQPDKVVSLGGVRNVAGSKWVGVFDRISMEGKGATVQFRLGAGVKLADLAASKELRQHAPALTTAAGMIGGPQI